MSCTLFARCAVTAALLAGATACSSGSESTLASGPVTLPRTSGGIPNPVASALPKVVASTDATPGLHPEINLQDDAVLEAGVARRARVTDANGTGEVLTVYRPAAGRPGGYPRALPFVAGVQATVHEYRTAPATVHWSIASARAAGFRDSVAAQLVADGWAEVPGYTIPGAPAFISARGFTRAGQERALLTAPVGDHYVIQLLGDPHR